MNSVNETNAITEYKKRLGELASKLPQSRVWLLPDGELTEDWYLKKQDVLDLINSTK